MNNLKNKILVVPGNTDLNRGDQALVWESIHTMSEVLPNLEVYLYESGANFHEKQLQKKQTSLKGYQFLERILLHPRVRFNQKKKKVNYSKLDYFFWGLIAVRDLGVTLLLLSKFQLFNWFAKKSLSPQQRNTLETFSSLQALVIKGGGFLHSYGKISDPYVMYFFLFDLFLAKKLKVKVIILPNSIGPIRNRLARWLVKRALSEADFVSVREMVSQKYLKNHLGIDSFLSPDLGFYLKNKEASIKTNNVDFLPDGKKTIAITLRPYRFDGQSNGEQLYQSYIWAVAKFADTFVKNYNILFVAHTLGPSAHEDDRIAIADVQNIMLNRQSENVHYIEDFELDCQDLQDLYSRCDYLVGTRFHSVIFALNVNTPAIAIAYGGNKSFGIMKDIGIDNFVCGIDSISDSWLQKAFLELVEKESEYKESLDVYRLKLNRAHAELVNQLSMVFS